MKKCTECNGSMKEHNAKTPEGFDYRYFKCDKCGEEVVNMKQLHSIAEKYRIMKRYNAKLSKWGLSLGVRIPRELVQKYKFKDNEEVIIVPEEKGIKIIPQQIEMSNTLKRNVAKN